MQNHSISRHFFYIFLGLILSPSVHPSKLQQCEKIFLGGKTIESYIKKEEELPENQRDKKYLTQLNHILKSKDCNELLKMATLKDNGLLIERSLLASDLLESFNQFHYQWVMPKDLDRSKNCVDRYQWDIYDPKAPAYHLTRALFQKNRKASQIVTSYGESRIVREGEDPTISPRTGRSSEEYKQALKTEKDLSFIGDGEIIGFLFERATNSPQFFLPRNRNNKEKWKKKMPFQNEHNIYQHFGGGILGSPSFLYYHLKERAYYESNGFRQLPRNLVDSIFQNLLCSSPSKYSNAEEIKSYTKEFAQPSQDNETSMAWNHPITKDASCLECHYPMDRMASGFRNLTLIPSTPNCSEKDIQILYPVFLKSDHSQEMWQISGNASSDPLDFSSSYGAGYFKGKRFRTLNQLGNLIAEDPRFYSCQVKRYYQWIHQRYPTKETVEALSKQYSQHQDGLTLLKEVLNHKNL